MDTRMVIYLSALVLLLIGAAALLPANTLTGAVVVETCAGGVCLELCDTDDTCSDEHVCCDTHWDSGICDYEANCGSIREYSLYQSLEVYSDSVREQPAAIQPTWQQFFLPLMLTLMIIAYFVWKRR